MARLLQSVFLFFFFKQKTAYEMRISDWSSDVCSSDLTALALRERAHFAADHGGADLALDDASLLDRADQWLGPLLTGKRRLDQIEPGEIGRASCRGRVCQYV